MIEMISLELRLIKSNYIEGGCEVDLIRGGVKWRGMALIKSWSERD